MHPMMKLLISNRKRGDFRAEMTGDNEATLYIYDMIVSDEFEAEYWGGVAPESFVKALNDINASVIHLRINSPGGSVFAARSMEQALREHSAKVVAHIDGYAASAASFLAMAADEIVINQGGFIMIHKAMTFAYGNADDLVNTADLLEKIDNSLVNTYHNRTQQDKEQIAQWMTAETWFGAEDAISHGFADRIEDGVKAENKAWDLSAYQHAPATEQNDPDDDNPITITSKNQTLIIKGVDPDQMYTGQQMLDIIERCKNFTEQETENDTTITDELTRRLDASVAA